MSAAPPMAITMGDASGVGPEIVLRTAAAGGLDDRIVVYGDASILFSGQRLLGTSVPIRAIEMPGDLVPGDLNVVDLRMLRPSQHRPGELSAEAGAAARVCRASDDRRAPGSRRGARHDADEQGGHAALRPAVRRAHRDDRRAVRHAARDDDAHERLDRGHSCEHALALREAIERVRADRVLDVIELTNAALSRFLAKPRVAVCGLNPHAGEHGLFGSEDSEHIAPAIAAACDEGIDASGPHPADTVFFEAVHQGRYDAIVCMYHDQGHAPMKLLAFEEGVNVTLGLPIVRTSVDHGTAFDIAWKGTAFTDSLLHALAYARKLTGP